MGAICALGEDVAEITDGLIQGRTGLAPSVRAELPYGDQVFGEVAASNATLIARLKDRLPDPPRSRTALLALIAAKEATASCSKMADTVVISASTVGGMDLSERCFASWRAGDMKQVQDALEHPVGNHTGHVARMIGSRAMRTTISTACSSSANALMMGAQLLIAGETDRVLAGGADALCRFTIEGFRSLSAMDPRTARPFSGDRDGMNLGEGAAYLMLERHDDVLRSGRTPLAVFAGWCNRNDAYHQTATSADGQGPYEAMTGALRRAGIGPTEVDHINAHGTGTDNNDGTELAAIERIFSHIPPFTSTKALTGHTLGAAGALEAVIAVICLKEGIIPAGPSRIMPMPGHRARPVTRVKRGEVRSVLSNSFGFGGNDTSLLFTAV